MPGCPFLIRRTVESEETELLPFRPSTCETRLMRTLRCVALPLLLMTVLLESAPGQQNPRGELPVTSTPHPYVFLIRDPVVLAELRASPQQREAIAALNAELDPGLWSMRNQGAASMERRMQEMTATARARMAEILNRDQQNRLNQIELWTLGTKAFMGDDLPVRLRLSEDRRQAIRERITLANEAAAELGKQVADGQDRKQAEKKVGHLQADLQRGILKELSETQKQKWIELLGRRVDLSELGQVTFTAPKLHGASEWINSAPLSSDSLRGKVVALHFYAFGCINCQRNFPWYKQWHETYSRRGLVVLGVHTPETQREQDVESVRRAAKEKGLEYPIVIDGEKKNWDAWGNSMWPATYLIDKQGRVRAWWFGELDWQGAGGQKLLQARIEDLLKEEPEG